MASAAARRRRYNTPRANYDSVAYALDYTGTADRPLRGGEQTQARPLVRPRERAAVRPKARVREAGAVSSAEDILTLDSNLALSRGRRLVRRFPLRDWRKSWRK